jgi:Flp pilus assembly protein TadG
MLAPNRPCSAAQQRLRRAAGHPERGNATLQMLMLMPALFLLMFLGLQAALIYQARTIALAAAQEGARTAAAEHGSSIAGISAASSFVAASTAGVSTTQVTGSRSTTTATITVTAISQSVIPGWRPSISQSASLPVERITRPPGELANPGRPAGET